MAWVDATFQAILSAKTLLRMGAVLGLENRLADLREEVERLSAYANRFLWDDKTAFYYDRYANGELSTVKHIGAYWALLAGCVPEDRALRFSESPGEPGRVQPDFTAFPRFPPTIRATSGHGGLLVRRRVGPHQFYGPEGIGWGRLRGPGPPDRTQSQRERGAHL